MWPTVTARTFGCRVDIRNLAVSGSVLADLVARAGATDAKGILAMYRKPWLVVWAGANDLATGRTATQCYNDLVAYCQARQAAGWNVAVLTILPRADGIEVLRAPVNTNIRANWATFADAVVDVAADSRIGDTGDNVLPYYYDGTHLTASGEQIIADLVNAMLVSKGI